MLDTKIKDIIKNIVFEIENDSFLLGCNSITIQEYQKRYMNNKHLLEAILDYVPDYLNLTDSDIDIFQAFIFKKED